MKLDHIHIKVKDQYKSAAWYEKVFGFKILKDYEHWAKTGPLSISADGGHTKLALFKSEETASNKDYELAIGATGEEFVAFYNSINNNNFLNYNEQPLMPEQIRDHGEAYSFYLLDIDKNRIELTSYDTKYIEQRIKIH